MNSDKLLQLIKEKYIPDLYIFPDKYAPIDSYSEKRNMWIEVKARQCKEDFYYDIMIEEHKYKKIVGVKKSRYIFSMQDQFGNIRIYSFNFNELPKPTWEMERRQISNEHPEKGYQDVNVAYFHIKDAKNLTTLLLD